ncbi:MAG: S1 RNA-binding domain-containing protein [Brevinema sp.]
MSTYDELFLSAMQGDSITNDTEQEELVNGVVINKGDNEYFLSVGDKSEWMLLFSEAIDTLNIGDHVLVTSIGLKDGIPYASQKKAKYLEAQQNIHQSSLDQTALSAKIEKLVVNKDGQNSGFMVSIDGVEAFLPLSHIYVGDDINAMIGTIVNVTVIKNERNRVVVSEKVIREKLQNDSFDVFQKTHSIGAVLPATVFMVQDTFALLTVEQITGFMPIMEFDWKFIKSLKDVIKKGDTFNVEILELNHEKKSVRVSRKATIVNPVDMFFDHKKVGDHLTTKVIRFAKGLAIVEDQQGVECLLPVSEMSWTSKVSDPKRLLNIGDRVDVKVKEMDHSKRRIIVSLRDLLENPWSKAETDFAVGSKQQGKISAITDFGIFVQFENGLEGLIRKEDIDWQDNNVNLTEKFQKNDSVTATVLHVDAKNEKLRLGIKQLSANPYQNFADNYKVGTMISGKVIEITKDRVYLVLENGLKSFIHVSQLSTEHVQDPQTLCKVGDELQGALRKISVTDQIIELSIRDAVKTEEKQELEKYLSAKETSAPTLGALFGDILKNK